MVSGYDRHDAVRERCRRVFLAETVAEVQKLWAPVLYGRSLRVRAMRPQKLRWRGDGGGDGDAQEPDARVPTTFLACCRVR